MAVLDDSDEEDEIVAEYPLFSASTESLFNNDHSVRIVNLHYPLRPPWRMYDSEAVRTVQYKPGHRVLKMTVREDRPDTREPKDVPLSGMGIEPEVPLCVMCKVDGCFVLAPISEITQMRPDMDAFVGGSFAKEGMDKVDEDPEYVPKKKSSKSAEKPKPAAPSTVKVEVKKRETDRQAQLRTRSYTYFREQVTAEEEIDLKAHGISSGQEMLPQSARKIIQQYPAEVAMGVPEKEFLKYSTPAVWLQKRAKKSTGTFSAGGTSGTVGNTTSEKEAPPEMTPEIISALKQAMEDLFADYSVVSMRDVRFWLKAYTANDKARVAALHSDEVITKLLLGGGSIKLVRDRFVLSDSNDPVRVEVIKLLQTKTSGLKKSEVSAALKAADVTATDHAITRVLRTLCVAAGAVWHLKEGAAFQRSL